MHRQHLLASLSAVLPLSFAAGPPPRNDVPPPAPPAGCLTLSLTSPAWEVESFQSYKTDRPGIEFTLKNIMDMSSFRCSTGSAETVGTLSMNCTAAGSVTDNMLVPGVVLDTISNRLSVNQEWVCNDNNKKQRITFVGNGTVTVKVECTTNSDLVELCRGPPKFRIPASLSSPLALTPRAPDPTASYAVESCKKKSTSPSWKVENITLQTGLIPFWNIFGVANAPEYMDTSAIGFTVTNEAMNATLRCSSSFSTQKLPDGLLLPPPDWTTCYSGAWEPERYRNAYTADLNFRFDPPLAAYIDQDPKSLELIIDQTWYCEDGGADRPIQFNAGASVKLPVLACTPRTKLETNITVGPWSSNTPVINGTSCTASSAATVTGQVNSRYDMEPFALQMPRAAEMRCTVDSVNPDNHHFFLLPPPIQFQYEYPNDTPPDNNRTGTLQLLLENAGLSTAVSCQAFSPELNINSTSYNPNFWVGCSPHRRTSDEPNYWDNISTNVSYNALADTLAVRQSWRCDDVSPTQRVIFRASSTIKLPKLNCTVDGEGLWWERTVCRLPKSWTEKPLPMEYSEITYHTKER